ncbi:MAG: hypothetical protein IJD22_03405 [Clostridia bacterium]|nr:hypothetical protein [Clostridia bacterium]
MRKLAAVLLILCMAVTSVGCALTEESGFDYTYNTLKEAESVTVHLYGEDGEEALEVPVRDELTSLFTGEWEHASGQDGGKKTVTVTVQTQHEITFFDNGIAMIYYGYASVAEKDRCYYSVKLDGSVEEICEYAEKHGVEAHAASVLKMLCGDEDEGKITAEFNGDKKETFSVAASSELGERLSGSWRATEAEPEGEAMVSLRIENEKYKILLYGGDMAMICELDSSGAERNRSYYSVRLDGPLEELYNYCCENGTVVTE